MKKSNQMSIHAILYVMLYISHIVEVTIRSCQAHEEVTCAGEGTMGTPAIMGAVTGGMPGTPAMMGAGTMGMPV